MSLNGTCVVFADVGYLFLMNTAVIVIVAFSLM